MTETPEPRQPLDPAQADGFRLALRKRGVEFLACPACGEDTWGGFANAAITITTAPDSDAVAGTVRGMLAVCGRCGYIAMFDRDVIGH